jgi:hypothetical protein
MNHQWQSRNNCGPASVAILLGYYGHQVTQGQVNEQIPPGPSPCEIVQYIADRYGGSGKMPSRYDVIDTTLMAKIYYFPRTSSARVPPIRLLLANGVPVIVLQRLALDSNIGHYRVIQGYDDGAGEFISDDPLLGSDYRIPYADFTRLLAGPGSGRIFIPVYTSDLDPLVDSLMRELGVRRLFNCEFNSER